MPITFRLRRDHLGAPYSSETNFVAISGAMEIGCVGKDVFSDQSSKFRWSISVAETATVMGWADTVVEARAALERVWLDWVARAELRDDSDAPPAPPVKDRG